MRRVSITNLGSRVREVELTSYAEIVLATEASDTAHPAFSKMFVQTEFDADAGAILATRRLRSPTEVPVWAAHLAVAEGESVGEMQFETDRARFLGRGRNLRDAVSVIDGRPLSDTVGTVLDPIFSVRRRMRIPAGATARVAFWTIVAPSRTEALDLVDKHRDSNAFERAVTLAWTQAQVQLHHLRVDADEAHLFQRIANRVLYSDPTLRPSSDLLRRGEGGQSKLWPAGISGDLPIVLVRIDETEDLEIVRELVRAHEYWRMKRLAVDLVILNERPPSYHQELQVRARGSRSNRAVAIARRRARRNWKCVRAARRPGFGRAAKCSADRGASGVAQPARDPVRASQTAGDVRAGRRASAAANRPRYARRMSRCRGATSNFSTGLADLPRTAVST